MIQVGVTSTLRSKVDSRLLIAAVRAAIPFAALVSVAVVGEARMRRLNRELLGHDYVTDVLSFDHGASPEGRMIEIVICAPFARRQAAKHGVPEKQELARYVIHGALHCAGFDDGTPARRKRMWRRQEEIMRAVFGNSYAPQGA